MVSTLHKNVPPSQSHDTNHLPILEYRISAHQYITVKHLKLYCDTLHEDSVCVCVFVLGL